MKVNALILAGAPNDGKLENVSRESWEALIPVCGEPMVSYVVSAVCGCEDIDKSVIVGPKEVQQVDGQTRFVCSNGPLLDNLMAGMAGFDDSEMMLVITADVPLVTSEMIKDFIHRCSLLEADFYYSVVQRQVIQTKYPNVQRTYARIHDGTFTGGNLALVNVGAARRSVSQAADWISNRKNVFKLAGKLGIGLILKFLLGRITMVDVEHRVSELFGIRAKAVVTPYAEIGVDVDKPSDFELVESVIAHRGNKSA